MRKKLQKIIFILAIISCIYQNSIGPIKGKEEQKELIVFTGAHYPSVYKGFTNQYALVSSQLDNINGKVDQ